MQKNFWPIVLCSLVLTSLPVLYLSGASRKDRVPAMAPSAVPSPAPVTSRALFERRILPLFRSPNPSSCADCHLSGVDLKDYIAETEEKTFLALRAKEMIDLRNPDESKILRFIQMTPPKSALISQEVRNLEYTAFRDWIRASASNPRLRSLASN